MKTLILTGLLFLFALSSFSQSIVNPHVERSDDGMTRITSIETDNQFTVVKFETVSSGDSAWVQVNKEIFIQTDLNNKHYNYVKSENIVVVPQRHYLKTSGGKLAFTIYFEKIPAETQMIDIIERPGIMTGSVTYFNFYNVSLQKVKVVDVTLTAPASNQDMMMPGDNNMAGMMNQMGPMFSNMATSMMDAQLNYYKKAGKIEEVAKLNKQYYNALIKAGFNADQALKIITSDGLLPKASIGGK